MAIYHAHFSNVCRSKGGSTVASAAYAFREILYDSRQGKWWDYRGRELPLACGWKPLTICHIAVYSLHM